MEISGLSGITSFERLKRMIFTGWMIVLFPLGSFATHNRAGQITFRLVSGYTYSVTVSTFTYTKSAADRSELLVDWGDNTSSVVARDLQMLLPNDYKYNEYTTTHTFPGPGIYQIIMQDPNRNYGIKNIPNSVNVIFSIKTTFIVSPDIGKNSSPILLNFPLDRAAKGHIFIHNPSAYDPDGDSLSYKLTTCTELDGKPIENYTLPQASDTIYVDPVVGDLVWYAPVDTGKYNVAINVEEWRKGVKIGNITRDMQIDVFETDNNAPVNPPLKSLCVEAGALIEMQLTTTDADNDSIRQLFIGGPLVQESSPATYSLIAKGLGFSTSTFRWQTTCDHIRRLPWQITLKSEDRNADIQLFDIDNFTIKVLAPAPKNVTSVSTSVQNTLKWNQSRCGAVKGYYVYRKEGNSSFDPDSCENGVPGYTGFIKIGTLNHAEDTVFVDDGDGEGLAQGIDYCYRITAYYQDGSESFASDEICASLIPGFPALLNTSVTNIDAVNGSVFISWIKPRGFDQISAPGPYIFKIYRSVSETSGFEAIDSIFTADLNDTTYTDILNTTSFPYYYKVIMFNNTPGNRFEMRPGESETASTLYLDIVPSDNTLTLNIRKKAPWINDQYVIYRSTEGSPFDSIGISNTNVFADNGLKNGQTFTYKVKSRGWRNDNGSVYNNSNLSHIISGTPMDINPPCAPFLNVVSVCDSNAMNVLTWNNPNTTCANDVVRYNIYYAPDMNSDLDSLTSVSPATTTEYEHLFSPGTPLAGCYSITAVDSFENESALSAKTCIDNCSQYSLPNIFTPNNDNYNDIYLSNNPNHFVEKVDMKIFNRYGQLVYETNDPDIKWDGKYRNTENKLATGVYYYVCDVYEPRISGIEIRTLVGFIHLYAEGDGKKITF